jgi:hypothetical protein
VSVFDFLGFEFFDGELKKKKKKLGFPFFFSMRLGYA